MCHEWFHQRKHSWHECGRPPELQPPAAVQNRLDLVKIESVAGAWIARVQPTTVRINQPIRAICGCPLITHPVSLQP
jgi:hypothetical protein